jgi:hypothetical protein
MLLKVHFPNISVRTLPHGFLCVVSSKRLRPSSMLTNPNKVLSSANIIPGGLLYKELPTTVLLHTNSSYFRGGSSSSSSSNKITAVISKNMRYGCSNTTMTTTNMTTAKFLLHHQQQLYRGHHHHHHHHHHYCFMKKGREFINVLGFRCNGFLLIKRKYHHATKNQGGELEQCMKQDLYNVNVLASRYGILTIPLAFGLDMALSSYLDIQHSITFEFLTTLTALHASWFFCLYKCLNDLHTANLDPLSNLAKRWDEQEENPIKRSITSSSKKVASSSAYDNVDNDDDREEADSDTMPHSFFTQEEWENARDNNRVRIRNSFDAGLFFPVSFLCAIAPFIPWEMDDDEDDDDEEEDSLYQYIKFPSEILLSQEETTARSLFESVVMNNNGGDLTSILFDSGLIGFCFLASFLSGRKAYRCWRHVQRTPPTNLPILVHLRRSARNS